MRNAMKLFDRMATDEMVAMVLFLAVITVLTVLGIFFPSLWWLVLSLAALGVYWAWLFYFRGRNRA